MTAGSHAADAVPVGWCWQRGLTIHSASVLMNKAGL